MALSHKLLYKILDEAPQRPVLTTLPTTELDSKDGFIHLSTAERTPTTANLFFAHCSKLWLLKLRSSDLDGLLKYPDDLPGCAHLHDSGTGLGKGNIEAVIEVTKEGHQEWTAVPGMRSLES